MGWAEYSSCWAASRPGVLDWAEQHFRCASLARQESVVPAATPYLQTMRFRCPLFTGTHAARRGGSHAAGRPPHVPRAGLAVPAPPGSCGRDPGGEKRHLVPTLWHLPAVSQSAQQMHVLLTPSVCIRVDCSLLPSTNQNRTYRSLPCSPNRWPRRFTSGCPASSKSCWTCAPMPALVMCSRQELMFRGFGSTALLCPSAGCVHSCRHQRRGFGKHTFCLGLLLRAPPLCCASRCVPPSIHHALNLTCTLLLPLPASWPAGAAAAGAVRRAH